MKAIRGATFVKEDSYEEIERATLDLMEKIFSRNGLKDDEVVSVIFSVTKDLKSMNPATIFRKSGHDVPLMCLQEADFAGAAQKVLRVLIITDRDKTTDVVNVYDGAQSLKSWRWER